MIRPSRPASGSTASSPGFRRRPTTPDPPPRVVVLEEPGGLLVVDKPPGPTSHDVVARLRRVLGTRRVGHAGTLDPLATGVLVCAAGWTTRLLRFVSDADKRYAATVVFGIATTTLDAGGQVTAEADASHLAEDAVRAAAAPFVGTFAQVPPMVSARKVGGRRLHELAREGIEVDREPRPVTVHELTVRGFRAGARAELDVEIACSKGTYIRSLAADIGASLGLPAHLSRLRRLAVGSFTAAEAMPLPDIVAAGAAGTLPSMVLPPAAALRDHASVRAEGDLFDAVRHGRQLPAGSLRLGEGPHAVLAPDGSLAAVYVRDGNVERPEVVVPAWR